MAPSPCLCILLLVVATSITGGLSEATAAVAAPDAVYLSPRDAPIHSERLGGGADYLWQLDYDGAALAVEVQIAANDGGKHHRDHTDWFAVGFSANGSLSDADVCVFWTDWRGLRSLTDASTDGGGRVSIDQHNDCGDFKFAMTRGGGVAFTFTRPFDVCRDEEDYVVQEGTTHVVWSSGKGPLFDLAGLNLADETNTRNGFARVRLLKNEDVPAIEDETTPLEITHEVDLPSDDTSYWCSTHKLPRQFRAKKHHTIMYEPIKTSGLEHILHHMEVFHCDGPPDEEFPLWSGPCGSDDAPEKLKRCKKVLAAWAIGAGPFYYPEEAGLAIGGEDFNPYIMLEAHYNNEKKESGLRDRSGMRLVTTSRLRPHDAGIMELGVVYSDSMAVPPRAGQFEWKGHCLAECTAQGFPATGVTVFGSQLHTHGTGARVTTRHVRNGVELAEINRDDHYSTHFQEIRALKEPRTVLPGDALVTTCTYDATNRDVATLGGYGFSEEMCVNYVHYFPRVGLEVCKSQVDSHALKDYFRFANDFDGQETAADKNISENYRAVDWTPLRTRNLQQFYDSAPVEMQCQSGDGSSLPGNWKGLSQTEITKPLPKLPRSACAEKPKSRRKRDQEMMKRVGFQPAGIRLLRERTRQMLADKRRRMELERSRPAAYSVGMGPLVVLPAKKAGAPVNEMRKRSSAITKKSAGDRLDALSNAIASFKLKKKRGGGMMSRVDMDALESDINEAFFLLNSIASDLEAKGDMMRPGNLALGKRGFRGKSLDQLEKDLAEAFAILDKMEVKRMPMTKRGVSGTNLDQLERNLAEAFAILDSMGVSNNIERRTSTKSRLAKRGLRGASLAQLEKNLAEAFAILDTMGISKEMKPGMAKRGLRGASLDQLEKNLAEAFAILDTMGVSNNLKRGMSKRGLRGASLAQLEKNLAEAFAILDTMGVSNNMKPGMSKRGLRGASLDQLEKNLAEAFAILDSMGASNNIKRSPSSNRMNGLQEAIQSFAVSKRSINNGKLATLEAKINEAFSILRDLGVEIKRADQPAKRSKVLNLNQLERDLREAFALANSLEAVHKRAVSPAKSSQLDKNLSEAFALLKRAETSPLSKRATSKKSDSKRATSKKSDRLVRLEAQLAEAFAILDDMGVSKRGGRGSGRLRELQNSLSEAMDVLAVSKRGVGGPARLRDLKNNLDEAFSILQVSKRSAQGSVSYDLDKLERNLNDAFALLAEMGVSDDGDALNMKKKRSKSPADPEALTAEDEEYLNQEDVWSDYPSWGLDKRGLGSVV